MEQITVKPKKKGIRQHPVYMESPFEVKGMFRKQIAGRSQKMALVDEATGEAQSVRLERQVVKMVDEKVYVKVFKDSLIKIATLPGPGLRMLMYMMTQIKPGRNQVTIEPESYLDAYGYAKPKEGKARSTTEYYKGIGVLLERDMIARKKWDDHTFFINPEVFFNGNRVNLVRGKFKDTNNSDPN